MKKLISLVLAVAMVVGMMGIAFASGASDGGTTYGASNPHTITISNTDQNVSHTYKGYQVFSGNLDSKELVLSDIQWGSGVNGDTLLAALKASTDESLKAVAADLTDGKDALGKTLAEGANIFTNCTSAADVARILATFGSTGQKYDEDGKPTSDTGVNDNAGRIDAVATIIGEGEDVLKGEGFAFTEGTDTNGKPKYTADVTGDGYYFIKDVTTNLNNTTDGSSDTKSKYLLSVVKDVTVTAKDTGLKPDKEILQNGTTTVKAGSAAIGDTVTFQVTVAVPNTKKYEEHFWFVMNDSLPKGITFTGISEVTIGNKTLKDVGKETTAPTLSDAGYIGENTANGWYTLKVNDEAPTKDATDTTKYTFETTNYDAVKEAGGQKIELTFNQFKAFVEANNLIGETVTVKYTGVVNDDAEYKATENENEVTFDYSNDPNHDYDGDTPNDDSVTGTTPKSTTRTYTTSLKIKKVDENNQPLAGAEFTLTGENLNRTVLTGTKFVASTYTLPDNGEAFEQASGANVKYWLLKDGSYTATDPSTVQNKTQYAEPTDTFFYKVIYNFVEIAPAETKTPLVIVTDAQGIAEFVGLNAGEYTLEETHSPEGYNKINGTATITIDWVDPEATTTTGDAKTQGGFTLSTTGDGDFADDIAWVAADKQFEVTIMNQKGSVLPSTGGIGTTIFYLIGAALVLGAGVLLVTKRKMTVK